MFRTVYAIAALVLRVAVVGDVGDGTAPIARGIAAAGPVDAIVLTGDNIYPCGVQSPTDPHWAVLQPLASLGIPIHPVLGNHDHCGNADAELGVGPRSSAAGAAGDGGPPPNWQFPSKEYTFATPFAEFAMIDTTPYVNGTKSAPQFSFHNVAQCGAAVLRGERRRGRRRHTETAEEPDSLHCGPWRIVVGHHPLLSSGYHGRFSRAEHQRMLQLIPAMRAAKVDLYICGHDHHLELIDGHPLMLISGAGSEPISAVLRHAHTRFVTEGRLKGFAMLELTATTMAIQFYDSSGKPISGRFAYARP